MKKQLFTGLAIALFMIGVSGAASAASLSCLIYSTDFETGVDVDWSNDNMSTSAHGGFNSTHYHGNYSTSGSTTLTLADLPSHTQLSLEFDLYLFQSWDGNNTDWGPDYFSLGLAKK